MTIYERYLANEITFDEMTISEFTEIMEEWKEDLQSMGVSLQGANRVVIKTLNDTLGDGGGEVSKNLENNIINYLGSVQ
jgi:hypothetical protein